MVVGHLRRHCAKLGELKSIVRFNISGTGNGIDDGGIVHAL